MTAAFAVYRDGATKIASVADELVGVGVECQGEKTVFAEDFGATALAKSERGGAATVVKNQSLAVIFEVVFDGGEERVGKIAVFAEILAGS